MSTKITLDQWQALIAVVDEGGTPQCFTPARWAAITTCYGGAGAPKCLDDLLAHSCGDEKTCQAGMCEFCEATADYAFCKQEYQALGANITSAMCNCTDNGALIPWTHVQPGTCAIAGSGGRRPYRQTGSCKSQSPAAMPYAAVNGRKIDSGPTSVSQYGHNTTSMAGYGPVHFLEGGWFDMLHLACKEFAIANPHAKARPAACARASAAAKEEATTHGEVWSECRVEGDACRQERVLGRAASCCCSGFVCAARGDHSAPREAVCVRQRRNGFQTVASGGVDLV